MIYAPPSYQSASYRQLWPIVAPHVENYDLYSACLVSRQWHQVFNPLLWFSPAARFGNDSDTVYLSLTRFKRLLNRVRPEVRLLAHTLHIPPAETEFYGGPQEGWLRDILDRLPALQALVVSNLSFFDHQSLHTIHNSCQAYTKYTLKLLIASGCENTTGSSLSSALSHFPDLIYLDLSGAQGSRSPYVLREIGTLQNLRVLKMQNCGLRDDDIDHLSFSSRLRSLDFSQNFITQRGIYKLSASLAMPAPIRRRTIDSLNPASPFARRYSGIPLPTRVLSNGVESYVANRLMDHVHGDIVIEEGLPKSFSHLYLASNYVSVDALSRLIDRPDLQYLDAGSLNLYLSHDMLSPKSASSGSARFFNRHEVETLSPALFTHAFRTLRSLRLHHSAITSQPFSGKDVAVEEQCFELHGEDLRYELDSTQVLKPGTFFELEDTSSTTIHGPKSSKGHARNSREGRIDEKAGEEFHATFESPDEVRTRFNPTAPMEIKEASNAGHGSNDTLVSSMEKHAPPRIAISGDTSHISEDYLVSPIISDLDGPERFKYNYVVAPETPWQEALRKLKPTTLGDIIEEVIQRKHRIEARERHPGRFKPSMLPNLKSLTLTDVPSTTRRRNVTDSFITFIQECAEEEELARLEEAVRNPGMSQHAQYLEGTFKLERLILEMTSLPDPILPSRSTHARPPHNKRHGFTKSSTEDADSENFMSHSETDFSFFGEDDGGLLVSEGRIDAPMTFDEGMMVEIDDGHAIDVVSELARFRREKKRKFLAIERSEKDSVTKALLGHWRGEIKIVKGVLR